MKTSSLVHSDMITLLKGHGFDYGDTSSILAQIYENSGRWLTVPVLGRQPIEVKYNRNTRTYNVR